MRPIIDSEYDLSDVNAAFAHMESNASTGKILIAVAK